MEGEKMNVSRKKHNSLIQRGIDYFGHLVFSLLCKVNSRLYKQLYPFFLRWLGIQVKGQPVFIAPNAFFDSSDYSLITLHSDCVISGYVRLLTHDYSVSRVAVAKGMDLTREFRLMKGIEIGKNAFIGTRSLIMPGVKIGENAIVGAGSVVTRDVEANTIVVGNPAKKISTIDEYWDKIIRSGIQLYAE